jgi:hypothetical protein
VDCGFAEENARDVDRRHAHHLLGRLGPHQFTAVVHLLEAIVSPDEEGDTLSDAERKAVRSRRVAKT